VTEDIWFDGRAINELPPTVYQECYVKNDEEFRPYVEKRWRQAALGAHKRLLDATMEWKRTLSSQAWRS